MSRRLATLRIIAVAAGAIVAVGAAGTVAAVEVVTHQPPAPLTVAQVAAKVRLSVVTIKATQFRDGVSEGQGFFFGGSGSVVTSASLLAHATHVDVIGPTGEASSAALVGIDKTHDIAELATFYTKSPALKPAARPFAVGAAVVVVGNPYSRLPYTVHKGAVAGTGRQLPLKPQALGGLIESNVVVDPANRGGALVDISGELVGIVEPGDTGHAFAVPVDQFSSQVKTWRAANIPIRLGPPLVTRDPPSLVLSGVSLGDMPQITKEAWGTHGIHVVFRRHENNVYGSVSVTIYLFVFAEEGPAHNSYNGSISNSLNNGFTEVGTTTSELGDEATALERYTSNQVAFNVIWRDRNVSVDMYLSGGITLSPDVSMENLIELAGNQETLIAENLADW